VKVRHLPTVVDAVVWDGSEDAVRELRELGLDDCHFEPTGTTGPATLVIHTLEGERPALPGDVVIRGVVGQWYPVKPDVYAASYEPADHDPHYVDFGEDGWAIQHPYRCRPNLLDCDLHRRFSDWMATEDVPPVPHGRYELLDDLTIEPVQAGGS